MKRLLQIIFIALLALVALASVVLVFPAYHKNRNLSQQSMETKQRLIENQQEYMKTRQKLSNLNNKSDEVERIAREKFNLCKESETVYKFKNVVLDTKQ
jgi:cell division protein FtsB